MSKEAQIIMPVASYRAVDITSEAVTIPAGAAGTVVNFYIERKPIADSNGRYIGGKGNTSIALTSTAFTTEVAKTTDANLSNGDFWIDYITGKGRGKKATTATTGTVDYKVFE